MWLYRSRPWELFVHRLTILCCVIRCFASKRRSSLFPSPRRKSVVYGCLLLSGHAVAVSVCVYVCVCVCVCVSLSLSLGSAAYLNLLPETSAIFLSCQVKIRGVIPPDQDCLICFRYNAYIHTLFHSTLKSCSLYIITKLYTVGTERRQ
jgi:hypothetical protein